MKNIAAPAVVAPAKRSKVPVSNPKPLTGKILVMDMADRRAEQKLRKDVEALGATVSDVIEHASAKYLCLVTDKPRLQSVVKMISRSRTEKSRIKSGKSTPPGSTMFSESQTTDSGVGMSEQLLKIKTQLPPVSRKRALRHRNDADQIEVPQTVDDKIRMELQRLPMVYRIAYQRAIHILGVDDFRERLSKHKKEKWRIADKKEKELRRAPTKSQHPTTHSINEKKLVPPYVKTQDQLLRYRPSYVQLRQHHLKNWLTITTGPGTVRNPSLFHCVDKHNKEVDDLKLSQEEPIAPADANLIKPDPRVQAPPPAETARSSRCTRKSPRFACNDRPYSPDPDRRGYCEICRREIDSMAKHSQGSTHIKRMNADGFWDAVDAECVSYHPLIKSKTMIQNDLTLQLRRDLYRSRPKPAPRATQPGTKFGRGMMLPPPPPLSTSHVNMLNISAVLPTDYEISTMYSGH